MTTILSHPMSEAAVDELNRLNELVVDHFNKYQVTAEGDDHRFTTLEDAGFAVARAEITTLDDASLIMLALMTVDREAGCLPLGTEYGSRTWIKFVQDLYAVFVERRLHEDSAYRNEDLGRQAKNEGILATKTVLNTANVYVVPART